MKADAVTDEDIIATLDTIFQQVLENDAIALSPTTRAEDIAGWDSLSRVTIAVEIEHAFKIKIKSAEMESLQEIGDVIALVKSHLAVTAS